METHKNHAYGAKSVTRETEKKRCFLGYGFKVLNFFGQKQPQNFFFLIIWAQKSKKSIRIFVVIIFVVFVCLLLFFCFFVVIVVVVFFLLLPEGSFPAKSETILQRISQKKDPSWKGRCLMKTFCILVATIKSAKLKYRRKWVAAISSNAQNKI